MYKRQVLAGPVAREVHRVDVLHRRPAVRARRATRAGRVVAPLAPVAEVVVTVGVAGVAGDRRVAAAIAGAGAILGDAAAAPRADRRPRLEL